MRWTIKQGNTAIQEILIKDADGDKVTTLAACTEIIFKVVNYQDDTVRITKTKGAGIEVNTPEEGYLRITLTPEDTELPVEIYRVGLQLKWSATEVYELNLGLSGNACSNLYIIKDIV